MGRRGKKEGAAIPEKGSPIDWRVETKRRIEEARREDTLRIAAERMMADHVPVEVIGLWLDRIDEALNGGSA